MKKFISNKELSIILNLTFYVYGFFSLFFLLPYVENLREFDEDVVNHVLSYGYITGFLIYSFLHDLICLILRKKCKSLEKQGKE